MRASRAYIASLGTAGVMVAFALLVLVVVGALLSFRGWPGEGPGADSGALEVGDGRQLIELDPVGFPASPAAVAAAERSSGARGDRVVVRGGAVAGGPEARDPGPRVSQGQAPGRQAADGGAAATGVGGTAESLSGVTEGVTRGAGEALGRVDSGLGRQVTETGVALGEVGGRIEAELEAKSDLPELP